MRKNDAFGAKIANTRPTKILWPFLPSPNCCQPLPPCKDPFETATKTTKTKAKRIDLSRLNNCTDKLGDPGLDCNGQGNESNCISMNWWCWEEQKIKYNTIVREPCPVLGEGIYTDNPIVCGNSTFWRKQPCGKDRDGAERIRCEGDNSGQCVDRQYWGVEGALDGNYYSVSCSDKSDLFRPIKTKTEDPAETDDDQAIQKQLWKIEPKTKYFYYQTYRAKKRWENGTRDEPSGIWFIPTTDPFKVPAITTRDFKKGPKLWRPDEYHDTKKETWTSFYNGTDYVKKESERTARTVSCGNHQAQSCAECPQVILKSVLHLTSWLRIMVKPGVVENVPGKMASARTKRCSM